MDEENIIYIPEADHQHLQSQEREQEFVEEENFMAYIDKFDQSGQDLLKRMQERIQKREKIWEDIRTREQEIVEKREEILEDIRTREQDIQKREEILEDILTRIQEIIEKREDKLDQMYQDLLTCEQDIQRRENKTTKTTISRHSTITSLLLVSVFVASRICSVGADFIPVESDLSLCKTDLSKLADTCDHDEGKAIHCVLNDKGELGIGCFLKTWVKPGYCPYFRNSFGVLDIRPCLGNSSICPTYQYLSNEVYKYPGCLINKSTRVPDILTNQTTESTTIRYSAAGDEKLIEILTKVSFGLLTLSLLFVLGLSLAFLRKKITSRGLRSAYAPASVG